MRSLNSTLILALGPLLGCMTPLCGAADELTGRLHDCNGNGIEDAVDIALGASADADANGVPDECEGAVPP